MCLQHRSNVFFCVAWMHACVRFCLMHVLYIHWLFSMISWCSVNPMRDGKTSTVTGHLQNANTSAFAEKKTGYYESHKAYTLHSNYRCEQGHFKENTYNVWVSHLEPSDICYSQAICLIHFQASFTLWLSDVMPQIFMTWDCLSPGLELTSAIAMKIKLIFTIIHIIRTKIKLQMSI